MLCANAVTHSGDHDTQHAQQQHPSHDEDEKREDEIHLHYLTNPLTHKHNKEKEKKSTQANKQTSQNKMTESCWEEEERTQNKRNKKK